MKRLDRGDIVVPTFDPDIKETESGIVGFQRRFVWRKPQSDRFIESLLLGLPVPGIFLVKEPSGVLLVLDGQQRLRTLQSFYRGVLAGKELGLRSFPWNRAAGEPPIIPAEGRLPALLIASR